MEPTRSAKVVTAKLSHEDQAWVRGFLRAYAMYGPRADPVPRLPAKMRAYGRLVWGEP